MSSEVDRRTRQCVTGEMGFTLVELMMVVTIAGILATLAEPSFHHSVTRAREAALKQNLFTVRDIIDQYQADRGEYPASLQRLVESGYLRGIPIDPLTGSASSWQEMLSPNGGISDIHSGSMYVAINGIPYNLW